MSQKSTNNLFHLLKKDDYQAFDLLFRKYYADLCKLSYRLTGDYHLAEEVVQELFLDLWKKRHRLEVHTSEIAYLKKATTFKTYDAIRKVGKIKETYPEEVPLVPDSHQNQEEILFADDMKIRLQKAIDNLPPRCQLIFKLSRFENLSYREIAEELDISKKSVEKQMSKALLILRQFFTLLTSILTLL